MKTFASYLLLFIFAQTAWPCANTFNGFHGTKYNGLPASETGRGVATRLRMALERGTMVDGLAMEEKLRGGNSFEDRNDYAVALMFLGRNTEALELLQKLETEKPGNYSIAANMGTAFELLGKNADALHWISEGIHRNPDSHAGTEWLHVKILEAKIAAESDTNYFKNHSVLNLKAGAIGKTIEVGDHKMEPKELMQAIQYQLTERLKFVEPPDPAVASLLFDYAALEARTGTLEGAEEILRLAREYGYPREPVTALIADYNRRIKGSNWAMVLVVGLAAVGFLVFCYRRGWFVLTSKDISRSENRR